MNAPKPRLGGASGDSLGGGVDANGTASRPVEVYLVEGKTPTGERRRRVLLSSTRAYDKATEWRRRGWQARVHRIVAELPAVTL